MDLNLNELPAKEYDISEDGADTQNPRFCTQVSSTYEAVNKLSDLPTISELQWLQVVSSSMDTSGL
jgi:hypothetical protein